MNIFKRRKLPEAEVTRIFPEEAVELQSSNPELVEPRIPFENKFEAGAYVVDLLTEANERLMSFYQEAKSRGMTDDDSKAAIKDAILTGHLPAIAERLGPPRGGIEPIFFIDTLTDEDKERLDVHVGERVKVSALSPLLNDLIKSGEAIVITPRRAVADSQLVNSPSQWAELTSKLEQVVHQPPKDK